MINNFYVSGSASFDWNQFNITNNAFIPGAQGNTDGRGYALDTTVGQLFPLFNTIGLAPGKIVKAPPANPSGYALFLDASAHYAYVQNRQDGFTDTSGLTFGTQQFSNSDIGARAKLIAVVPDRGFAWMPFVAGTVDRQFGVHDTVDVPAQAALPADTFTFFPATTFWGAELGLDIVSRASTKFGMKVFYQASSDTQTFGGSAFLRIPFEEFATIGKDSGIRIAPRTGMPVKAPPLPQAPAFWSWAGLYIGGHVGGGLNKTKFADPFGASIYGDTVRSPAFLGGGQIGYNWQAPNSHWVFGVEADASLMSSDGDNTCFAASSTIVNSTCRVRPKSTGTFTGRVGYVLDPMGRTMIYGKAGLAWARDEIDMALNTGAVNLIGAAASALSNNQSTTLWGGTIGVGVERALTPAWSVKAEYDYVDLGHGHVANLGNVSFLPSPPFAISGAVAAGTSGVLAEHPGGKARSELQVGRRSEGGGVGSRSGYFPERLVGERLGSGGRRTLLRQLGPVPEGFRYFQKSGLAANFGPFSADL